VSLPPPSVAPASMPYKLFDYFVEAEQKQFYGRERDVEEVVARVASSRTLVLYGRSGIGKTSLVRAGVIPVLVERGFAAVYVRLFRAPLDDLRVQVAAALGIAKGPLQEVVAACDKPVVIVLDQLEELFIRFENPDDRRAVAAELEGLLAGAGPDGSSLDVRLVLSLRHDWVASLEDLGPAWSDLLDRRYRLRGLSAFGARRAIVQPLAEAKETFTPKLVNLLVDELDASGFDPLLLQILCSEVYREAVRRSPEAVRPDVEDHFSVGGADGIFLHYLDNVAAQVPAEQQLLLRLLLDAMITTERTKRTITVDGLLVARFRATRAEVEAMLNRLVEGRLVRAQAGGETWYELVHDRLVEVTLGWLERDHDFVEFRFARSLMEDLSRTPLWQDDINKLLSRGQLEAVIGPYRDRMRPDEREAEFLVRSAIAAKSGELGCWARQYGTARTAAPVLALLKSRDARLRAGAAWAVGTLGGDDPETVARCRDLALRDPDEDVQREAARAFAGLASPSQSDELWAALHDASTREKAALEVLAQMIRTRRHVPRFVLRDRQAHVWAESLLRVVYKDELSARERAGTWRGFLAGLAWWGMVNVAFILRDGWSSFSLVLAICVLLVSSALGRFTVRSAAYAEYFQQDVRWSGIVFDRRVAPWFGIPLVFSVFVMSMANHLTLLEVAGFLAIGIGSIITTLALAQRMLNVDRVRSSRFAWATALVCMAVPPLVPWLIVARFPSAFPGWFVSSAMLGLTSSLVTWSCVIVLGLDSRRARSAPSAAAKPSTPAPTDL
jgi:hypothetical protein